MKAKLITTLLCTMLAFSNLFSQGNSATKHYVGEKFGGGIVYMTYDDGAHGLIASETDLGRLSFFPLPLSAKDNEQIAATIKTRSSSKGFQSEYLGQENTNSIVAAFSLSESGKNYAAAACKNFNGGNQSDWYLPSSYELKLLCDNLFTVNTALESDDDPKTSGLTNQAVYVSSTCQGLYPVFYSIPEARLNYETSKTALFYVRAIRKF